MNVSVYVLTNKGWLEEDKVFTPDLMKVKKNALAEPIKSNEELTRKLKVKLPMVKVIRGFYLIQAI